MPERLDCWIFLSFFLSWGRVSSGFRPPVAPRQWNHRPRLSDGSNIRPLSASTLDYSVANETTTFHEDRLVAVEQPALPSLELARLNEAAHLEDALQALNSGQLETAFVYLTSLFANNPQTPGLAQVFEECLRRMIVQKTLQHDDSALVDRFGLASLLMEQERYIEALSQLQVVVKRAGEDLRVRALQAIVRAQGASCLWDENLLSYQLEYKKHLLQNSNDLPSLHPFTALQWNCITLVEATEIARRYAARNIDSINARKGHGIASEQRRSLKTSVLFPVYSPTIISQCTSELGDLQRPIRLGYLSPDFTRRHPLAFLTQDLFGRHSSRFEIFLYATTEPNKEDKESVEMQSIQSNCRKFTVISNSDSQKGANQIKHDELDILVDLCGFAGSAVIGEIMAHRAAPIQLSLLGFPGSLGGASYIDYLVADTTVVPPHLRPLYPDSFLFMPDSYFPNSHRVAVPDAIGSFRRSREELRQYYGLPTKGFVFCCHNRPSKFDPVTFRCWLRALQRSRQLDPSAVLWLLTSGPTCVANLKRFAEQEGVPEEALVFCDIVDRPQHLERLPCADLFLDTPCYNAHTVGCDALYAGLPIVTLLRNDGSEDEESSEPADIATNKWASRVGASLLKAAGLPNDFVCPSMKDYEDCMVRCVQDPSWFRGIQEQLLRSRSQSRLFDTQRWVENFELGLQYLVSTEVKGDVVIENDLE